MGVFRLVEVEELYDYGVATDGIAWIFINKEREIIDRLTITENFGEIRKYLKGEERLAKKRLEEISKAFYEEYNDILHGVNHIAEKDCLIDSIINVDGEEDREEIAQIVVNRLVFIKFLQAMDIIADDALDYLYELEEHELSAKLNQLFFEVMNTPRRSRGSIDPHFEHIPYLNGSLFERMEVERRNPQYRIRGRILQKVIEFLNRFSFARAETQGYIDSKDRIDPEILGYIFERSMTATDRHGTGADYTPREVTRYISENTIHPTVLQKANQLLEKRGTREASFLTKFKLT